ncbi:MAG: hypothetical protein K2N51_08465 [Lachnospiraceae bacterium]|nr:hypothetical protein [Lachnospiraceae bacterium]
MFEQDYIMRLIKEMVRAILKLLFHIDTESPTSELIEDEKEKAALEALLDMVDEGSICKAENIVFEMIDAGDRKKLELVLLFYSYLNDKSDEFLEQNNFSRRQLQDNLKYILTQYGLGSIAETFLL